MTSNTLDYASPVSPSARPRLPRWLVVVGAGLVGAYVVLMVIVILTSTHPSRAARDAVREHGYAVLLAGASMVGGHVLRRLDVTRARRTSRLAAFAALVAVMNPAGVGFVSDILGVGWMSGDGDSEVKSFVAGCVALVAGAVAVVRIRRALGSLDGIGLAIAGTVIGGLWVGFWVIAAIVFAIGMSAF